MVKLLLHQPLSIIDKTICVCSRGKYCHVSTNINDIIYEARPFVGVRKFEISQLNNIETKNKIIDIYNVPNISLKNQKNLATFFDRQLGKSYDYFGALGFILYTTRQSRIDSGKWICSELATAGFEKIGNSLLGRCNPWKISPVILSYSPHIQYEKTIVIK